MGRLATNQSAAAESEVSELSTVYRYRYRYIRVVSDKPYSVVSSEFGVLVRVCSVYTCTGTAGIPVLFDDLVRYGVPVLYKYRTCTGSRSIPHCKGTVSTM